MRNEREPFGMFYVLVDPESHFEKILAIITMAPYFIVCALTTLIARCRELVTITWLVGHLLNEVVNFGLKRLLKEERPAGAPKVGFDSHGMPSAHSQFMGFFLSFAICMFVVRVRVNIFLKLIAAACSLILSTLVCYSRIELGFHTVPQVRYQS
jgi:dolichyldiphosphatase